MNPNPNCKPSLSIVIPAFNEEQSLREILNAISVDVPHEIIVIDDGSTDNTFPVAKEYPYVRSVHHIINRGYGAAIVTGFRIAEGDIIVTIDADAQNDPKEILDIIKPIISGGTDVVIGSRYLNESNDLNISLIKRIGEKFISFVLKKRYGIKITNSQSGFRALRRNVLEKILPLTEERFGFNIEFLTRVLGSGFKVLEVPKKEVERKHGKSKIKVFRDGLRIVYALIKSIID